MSVWLAINIGVFLLVLVYANAVDVRRLKLRARVRSISDPDSDLYRRNLPMKTTWHDVDHEIVDRWSERVFGVWWGWRAAYCLLGTSVLAAFLIWMRPASFGKNLLPVSLIALGVVWSTRGTLRKAKDDLATALLVHAQSEM